MYSARALAARLGAVVTLWLHGHRLGELRFAGRSGAGRVSRAACHAGKQLGRGCGRSFSLVLADGHGWARRCCGSYGPLRLERGEPVRDCLHSPRESAKNCISTLPVRVPPLFCGEAPMGRPSRAPLEEPQITQTSGEHAQTDSVQH